MPLEYRKESGAERSNSDHSSHQEKAVGEIAWKAINKEKALLSLELMSEALQASTDPPTYSHLLHH